MMSIYNAKAVFFDWDGTLVDSFLFLYRAHNHTCSLLGRDNFSVKDFRGYFGQPREKLYTQLYGEHKEEAKKHFEAYVLANHTQELKAIEGSVGILKWFSKNGIPCGVVTNKKATLVRAEIEAFGWERYFCSVVGAGEAAHDKPSDAPLRLAIERAGLVDTDHSDIWFVGDTNNDLRCANTAGCPTVFIESLSEYELLSADHKIDLHFIDCQSFCDFLLQSDLKSIKA